MGNSVSVSETLLSGLSDAADGEINLDFIENQFSDNTAGDIIDHTYYVHNVDEVIKVVKEARQNNTRVRCVGSSHSYRDSIFADIFTGKNLKLEGELRTCFEPIREIIGKDGKKYLEVRVGAGMNIDRDPNDLHSTYAHSFVGQVDSLGYALPITGGVSCQTIAGFLSTGSAGGSIEHGMSDVIEKIEFVNGKGEYKVANRNDDLWCAVGVSMGLFGVITHVTFLLAEHFFVTGTCENKSFEDSAIGPDSDGNSNLWRAISTNEYFRAMWLPQKGVNRVQQWIGNKTNQVEEIKPYRDPLSDPFAAAFTSIFMRLTSDFPSAEDEIVKFKKIIAWVLKQFVPIEGEAGDRKAKQEFHDIWHKVLPMDNHISYALLLPLEFAETWLPVESCQIVMDKLQEMFKDPKVAGNFSTELYSAKESPFWLSMSYGGHYVRVDAIWNKYNNGNARDYFSHFWQTLMSIDDCRLHWGKWMPKAGEKVSETVTYDLQYLKKVYPKLEQWLELRKENDPDNIFLNEYWAGYFEIILTDSFEIVHSELIPDNVEFLYSNSY